MKKQIHLSDHFTFRRLLRFTLPSIGMMVFTSIYGIVDGFFISNFAGKTPFVAVNLIYPLLMILAAVGFMFGTGGAAIVARTLGMKDRDRANRYFSLFTYIALALGLVLAVLGIVFLRPLVTMLGGEGQVLEDALLYGRILLLALPFNVLQYLFQSFFVTAERPNFGLMASISAGVTNMVLDAVLVILLPQPYKLAGAAVATAMSQLVGGGLPLLYFGRKNNSLLKLGKTRFEGSVVMRACINGSSEFLSNISMNVVGVLYNLQLLKYAGENGLAAYGVMMYVSFVFASVFIGYSVGTAPLFGYNDGAQNHKELKNILRKSFMLISISSLLMLCFAQFLTRPTCWLFVGYDSQLLAMTVSGFQIFSISFLFIGFGIFSSGFFTAMNDGLTSAIVSFLRTMIFQTAAILQMPRFFGLDGIWWSTVVAEGAAMLLCCWVMIYKRQKNQVIPGR